MAFPIPRKTKVQDPSAQRYQDSAQLSFTRLADIPFLDGVLVENIAIITGAAKLVSHGLGREPRGWLVVKKNANATVWETTTMISYQNQMTLNSSANVTLSLWVF